MRRSSGSFSSISMKKSFLLPQCKYLSLLQPRVFVFFHSCTANRALCTLCIQTRQQECLCLHTQGIRVVSPPPTDRCMFTFLMIPYNIASVGTRVRRAPKSVWGARCSIRSPSCTAVRMTMKTTATKKTTSRAWPPTASTGRVKTRSLA